MVVKKRTVWLLVAVVAGLGGVTGWLMRDRETPRELWFGAGEMGCLHVSRSPTGEPDPDLSAFPVPKVDDGRPAWTHTDPRDRTPPHSDWIVSEPCVTISNFVEWIRFGSTGGDGRLLGTYRLVDPATSLTDMRLHKAEFLLDAEATAAALASRDESESEASSEK